MRRMANKNRKQDRDTKLIILLTALVNLIAALINLINKLSE